LTSLCRSPKVNGCLQAANKVSLYTPVPAAYSDWVSSASATSILLNPKHLPSNPKGARRRLDGSLQTILPQDPTTLLTVQLSNFQRIADDPASSGIAVELKADAASVPTGVIHAPSDLGKEASTVLSLNP
jgi:hypothetical protein